MTKKDAKIKNDSKVLLIIKLLILSKQLHD